MITSRRLALFLTYFLTTGIAFSQLKKTVYSEEQLTLRRLREAVTIEGVIIILAEWDNVVRDQLRVVDLRYESDYEKIVDKTVDTLKDKIRDPIIKDMLKKAAPKILAYIEKAEALLKPFGWMFILIEGFSPSQIAGDGEEIKLADKRVQEEGRDAITRVTGRPWWDSFWGPIRMPETGPTLRAR